MPSDPRKITATFRFENIGELAGHLEDIALHADKQSENKKNNLPNRALARKEAETFRYAAGILRRSIIMDVKGQDLPLRTEIRRVDAVKALRRIATIVLKLRSNGIIARSILHTAEEGIKKGEGV